MEGGVVGAASEDDGGKAVTCRIQARAAAPGDCEEGPRRRGQGRGGDPLKSSNHMHVTAEEFSELNGTFAVILFLLQVLNYIHKYTMSLKEGVLWFGGVPVQLILAKTLFLFFNTFHRLQYLG